MNNTPPLFPRRAHVTPNVARAATSDSKVLLDYGTEDGMSTDRASANKLPAEQQMTRFLHWLQFTDRGAQPC